MIPRYRFKNAQTRERFCELALDPGIPPGALRALAHISPRVPDVEWRMVCQELQALLVRAGGSRRRSG